jgi:hypothetical protein
MSLVTVSVPILSPPPGATIAPTTVRKSGLMVPRPDRSPLTTSISSVLRTPSTLVQPLVWVKSAQTFRVPGAPILSFEPLPSIVIESIVAVWFSVVVPASRRVTS